LTYFFGLGEIEPIEVQNNK